VLLEARMNAFLKRRAKAGGKAFHAEADYRQGVDGKPRRDGVQDFLASRGIQLPEGPSELLP